MLRLFSFEIKIYHLAIDSNAVKRLRIFFDLARIICTMFAPLSKWQLRPLKHPHFVFWLPEGPQNTALLITVRLVMK